MGQKYTFYHLVFLVEFVVSSTSLFPGEHSTVNERRKSIHLKPTPPPLTPNTHHPSHGFIKNLPQLHLRDSYVRFSGKNKVDNTM